MKKQLQDLCLAVLLGMIVPQFIVAVVVMHYRDRLPEELAEPTETTAAVEKAMTVSVLVGDTVQIMDMEEYLTGVVLQEMPRGFSFEAKKAQAVVARTYALRQCASDKHSGAVCTASACCQAYISPEQYLEKGGDREAVEQAREAAELTEGLVLTYEGALIEATYFSCSGGKTEEAVAVWGADIPYLQSVESPGEEDAEHYVDTVTFTEKEVLSALQLEGPLRLGTIVRTEGGGVATIVIGEKEYTGVQLRHLLGLRSTCFYITQVGDTVTVTTRGFGHRVGMSQYGADAMAKEGGTFDEILAHYYPGTALTQQTES